MLKMNGLRSQHMQSCKALVTRINEYMGFKNEALGSFCLGTIGHWESSEFAFGRLTKGCVPHKVKDWYFYAFLNPACAERFYSVQACAEFLRGFEQAVKMFRGYPCMFNNERTEELLGRLYR